MLWIFALAIIMPIDIGLCASVVPSASVTTTAVPVNLTAITWDHAVNRKEKLDAALKSQIEMIEADVNMGKLKDNKDANAPLIPVMAHDPLEESDLTLDDFIENVNTHNKDKNENEVKGIKLDFKSLEAFSVGQPSLKKLHENVKYPVWLNADIINGPVNGPDAIDAKAFLELAKTFPKFVLSVGWTTKWTDAEVNTGKYSQEDVNKMMAALNEYKILDTKQPITFPVRAGPFANSKTEMKDLLDKCKDATFTVWSSPIDAVNVPELQKLILEFGVHKVYLDVPKELSNQLNLSTEKPSKSSANKFAHIGLLTIIMLIFTKLF